MTDARYDVCVVGAGLIGLAVARALVRSVKGVSVVIFDKEDRVAAHQSSHNSGVVHSGLYYQPGSLKAELCVAGRDDVYEICEEAGIPTRRTGKLVIATRPQEVPALDELERRGRANGLAGLMRLGPQGIREVEPDAAGIDALHVPDAGVADFPELARHFAAELTAAGCEVGLGEGVTAIEHTASGVNVTTGQRRIAARALVNCAGLQSDRVARMAGASSKVRIVPFRGEYYKVGGESADLVRNLIYPVPDPRFPFLGVHFTRRIDGTVEVGPNALLALGREHYRGAGINWPDFRESLSTPGLRRLAWKHWNSGLRELAGSRSRRVYAGTARRLVPGIKAADLTTGNAGIRAQAISADGTLVDDFVIEEVGASIHVVNAPSPGATACTAIGRRVAERVLPLLS